MILLPLRPASLTNSRRRKINCGMRSLGRKRSIDRSEDVLVEYPVCVISVAVVKRRLFLFVFDVIYNRRSIFVLQ